MPDSATTTAALARFRDFYDSFSAAWIPRLEELYAPDFDFADPFTQVRADFGKLRAHFTKALKLPESRFIVEDIATGADGAYVRWRWEWKLRAGSPLRVTPGVTHLRLAADGRITYHRDVFDAASGFYAALPGIGTLLRAIQKRV